jgi:hypothetical protein
VSHTLADQTSILRLIEDHWLRGERISETSFDRLSRPLLDLFDFSRPVSRTLILAPPRGCRLPQARTAGGAGREPRGPHRHRPRVKREAWRRVGAARFRGGCRGVDTEDRQEVKALLGAG